MPRVDAEPSEADGDAVAMTAAVVAFFLGSAAVLQQWRPC